MFQSLQRYFDRQLTKDLYLLQFRECDDKNCYIIKNDLLPPLIPMTVMAPDGEHYLAFNNFYGKFQRT